MRGGHGQVTAFFLIGLAVLFVFVIILLVRQAILSRNAATPPALGQPYDASRIKGYVESCIDLVTDDAFQKLGQQGGLLYVSQGGLIADNDLFSIEVHTLDAYGNPTQERVKAAFGLINDSGFPFHPRFQGSDTTEYKYPFPGITLSPIAFATAEQHWSNPSADGAFGQYSLAPLCDLLGQNNGSTAALRCPTQLFPVPASPNSTQASLANFIATGVNRCIDTVELSTQLGADVTIGQSNVTVTFTPHETLVALDLPLRFTAERGALRLSTFSRRYSIRLVQLSWFSFNLLKRASKDPYFRFNDSADYSTVVGYDGFVVTEHPLAAASANRDDLLLVIIADPSSKVDQATWFFQFLVQDRAPVLDHILGGAAGAAVTVRALDPDGDALNATITNSGGIVVAKQQLVTAVDRTASSTFTSLTAGTYNASVKDTAGLSDWQVFTLS